MGNPLEQQTRKLVFKGLAAFCPQVPQLLLAGIAVGQYGYCNRAGHLLGYAVVGGTHTQEEFFRLEAEHFYKCGGFAYVMGAASTQFSGDRTVLTVHLH